MSDDRYALPSFDDVFEPQPWMKFGLCTESNRPVGVEASAWFPGRGKSAELAKALCFGCPVQLECVRYGASQKSGVWGGLTGSERRALRESGGDLVEYAMQLAADYEEDEMDHEERFGAQLSAF